MRLRSQGQSRQLGGAGPQRSTAQRVPPYQSRRQNLAENLQNYTATFQCFMIFSSVINYNYGNQARLTFVGISYLHIDSGR